MITASHDDDGDAAASEVKLSEPTGADAAIDVSRRLFRTRLGNASVISASSRGPDNGARNVSKRRRLTIRNTEEVEKKDTPRALEASGRSATPRHHRIAKSAVALLGAAAVAAVLQYGAAGC